MSQQPISLRIERAKELLRTVRHAALATVNEDGSPHNSPVFAGFNDHVQMFWSSHPDTLHSQNIARTGQAYIVVFDSLDKGGGLYINAQVSKVADKDLPAALRDYNRARLRHLREEVPLEAVQGEQRLYCATPVQLWVNMAQRNDAGQIIKDNRYRITLQDLQ